MLDIIIENEWPYLRVIPQHDICGTEWFDVFNGNFMLNSINLIENGIFFKTVLEFILIGILFL